MLTSHTYRIPVLIRWIRVKAGLECVVANPATIHKSKEKGTVKDKFQEFQNILCNCQVLNSLHTNNKLRIVTLPSHRYH